MLLRYFLECWKEKQIDPDHLNQNSMILDADSPLALTAAGEAYLLDQDCAEWHRIPLCPPQLLSPALPGKH